MKITLAGYNVDATILSRARRREGERVTPEVISAAYARISRDPRSVGALRAEAAREVARARRSNERIVFGLGHASVAEHAVLNFDVLGVSRLAVEEIEHFRLASFTEKSQRYIRLDRDVVVPREIVEAGAEREFRALVTRLHRAYERAFRAMGRAGVAEGPAKEDARYLMPLATATQLGMTINARELEYVIMRLAANGLAELRELSGRLYRASKRVVPSLIRYPGPTPHWAEAERGLAEIARIAPRAAGAPARSARLLSVTPDAELRLAACLVFASRGCSFAEALRAAKKASRRDLDRILRVPLRHLGPHDQAWRAFEEIGLRYELVVSASCYAQLKRHRMATLIVQDYDPSLGVSVPATMRESGIAPLLEEHARASGAFCRTWRRRLGRAAEYALTNAHRRRVLFSCNLRELYHFSRLRGDASAQWEIRELSDGMCRLAARELPAAAALLGGKDVFPKLKESFDRGE